MAIQDDIMAMLSQVSDAGDRATSREALGRKLYAEMGDRLSGDALYNALRDVESARGSMGEMEDYSRVADILEKYMQDAGDGASVAVPDDMIVDDTRAAERMMEVMPSPEAAPRTPVSVEELPPMSRPELDETAMASMAREFGGERQMNQERLRAMGLSSIQGGAIPLRDRLMEGQGEPMSGTEQLMFASAFIPAAAIPQIGRILGMGASQIRNFLRAGDKGSEAMGQILQQRAKSLSPDKLAEVQLLLPKPTAGAPSSYVVPSAQVGAQGRQAAQAAARARQAAAARARQAARGERSGPDIPITPSPAQRLGSTQGSGSAFDDLINRLGPIGMAGGMSVRDNILRNYAMMDDGGYVDDEETKRIEDMNRRMDEATRDYLKGFPQGFVRDVRGLIDSDERLLNKAAKENIKAQGRRNFKRAYGMADGGYVATGEQGNYNENVVQQMRRLKREFGTDEAVDLMREMYPEYWIRDNGLIMGKPKRSNDDSFPVPNAPFEMIQNYLRHGHVLGKDYRDLKKKQ